MPSRSDFALAGATLVGVPAAVAALGGSVTYAGTVPLAVILAGVLFLRHRWPVAVMLFSVASVIAYHISGLIDLGWAWPASAAIFSVAAGPRKHGMVWAIGASFVAVSQAWAYPPEEPAALGMEILWLALVLAGAGAYRNWRGWQAETAARVAQLERERDLEAERNAAQERLLMARELHDVVAHTLTVVGVQLRVADEALEDSPDEARQALRAAQQVRGKAVADLRLMVDVLRERQPFAPQGDLTGLQDLVTGTRNEGLDITLTVQGDPATVPAPVALAVYRIVQESLTNVVKHASASRAGITLRLDAEPVCVEVTDDGRGGDVPAGSGHGIAGMRERVAALGGTFHAGPCPAGGFRVTATIPVRS